MPRLTYIGIHGHYVQSSLLDNCLFLKIWPDLFAGSLTEVLFIRDDHTWVISCKSRHLLIQFWAKTSHFGCQPPVSSLPHLFHTCFISPVQSLVHHHIASLCKALFFPQMICSAAAGWPRALREAPWAEPGVTLGLWAKQQLQAQAVKRPTQLRLSDIL